MRSGTDSRTSAFPHRLENAVGEIRPQPVDIGENPYDRPARATIGSVRGRQPSEAERVAERALFLTMIVDVILLVPFAWAALRADSPTMAADVARALVMSAMGAAASRAMRGINRGRYSLHDCGTGKIERMTAIGGGSRPRRRRVDPPPRRRRQPPADSGDRNALRFRRAAGNGARPRQLGRRGSGTRRRPSRLERRKLADHAGADGDAEGDRRRGPDRGDRRDFLHNGDAGAYLNFSRGALLR